MSDSEEKSNEVSSNDDDTDDSADEVETNTRPKRAVHWINKNASSSSDCGWPPNPSNSNQWPPWKILRETRPGNPYYGPRMQLYSATGWMLGIYGEHEVRGSQDVYDRFTYLELSYAGIPGHIRIQCMENHLYLAMNKKGQLYGERNNLEECTVFIESLKGSYNTYLSRHYAHLGWYIGLKRSGKIKKGSKTGFNQKACKFLPRRNNFQ